MLLSATELNPGVDPTKLFFFANEEFFRFSLVSLHFCNIQKKIIDSKMTQLNSKEKKTEKKSLIGSTPDLT